ncbi:unnamed protein product [Linum trigynum]|uniref:GRF-type domain-containing protein n=1 Tax=Linum trigynum TaxID=586398 RepID=A0AAV2DFF7_9ROSI
MSKRASSSTSTSINSRGAVLCWHKKPCVVNTSGTEANPGRQFYGCPFWMDEKKNCRFFRWVRMNVDEDKHHDSEIGCSTLNIEESLRLAECKAERRKKEKKLLAEELSRWMKAHEIMLAEGRRVNHEIHVIQALLIVIVVLNLILVILMLHHVIIW